MVVSRPSSPRRSRRSRPARKNIESQDKSKRSCFLAKQWHEDTATPVFVDLLREEERPIRRRMSEKRESDFG